MNKSPLTRPKTAPFLALFARGTLRRSRKHAVRPEMPSLILGPVQLWTPCLTSWPDGLQHPSGLLLPIDSRWPIYRTVGVLLGTPDPGPYPLISVRVKLPVQPEATTPAAPVASPAPDVEPSDQPTRPEESRAACTAATARTAAPTMRELVGRYVSSSADGTRRTRVLSAGVAVGLPPEALAPLNREVRNRRTPACGQQSDRTPHTTRKPTRRCAG